jgi:hypothetical protein
MIELNYDTQLETEPALIVYGIGILLAIIGMTDINALRFFSIALLFIAVCCTLMPAFEDFIVWSFNGSYNYFIRGH